MCLLALGLLAPADGPSAAAQEGGPAMVGAAGLHELVGRHAGRVVVVNFWATWCPPCKAEFPDIVRFYDDYRAQGVDVIAVSMNADDELEDVAAFLQEFQPPFPVYRAATQDETFYAGVLPDAEWFGELPITLVFDASGQRVRYHREPVTYNSLAADVGPLLSPTSPAGHVD